MFFENDCAQDPQNIANLFAKFFQNVYVKDDVAFNVNELDIETSNKMTTLIFSEDDIELAFRSLDINKGPGPDGIATSILTHLADVLKVPLTLLFNLSLSSGVFPKIWKESHVVPLFKNGDRRDISCYRGISILSAIPKTFEKLVCDKITPVCPSKSVVNATWLCERSIYHYKPCRVHKLCVKRNRKW
jgi:hypothetical protein